MKSWRNATTFYKLFKIALSFAPQGRVQHRDLSAEWLAHTPARLVNQHLCTGEEFVDKIAKKETVITPIKSYGDK